MGSTKLPIICDLSIFCSLSVLLIAVSNIVPFDMPAGKVCTSWSFLPVLRLTITFSPSLLYKSMSKTFFFPALTFLNRAEFYKHMGTILACVA